MEFQELMTVIGNFGFPIACVIVMFFMWDKERREHKDEVTKMTEAVNNNTTVLEKILTLLGVGKDGK